MKIDTNTILIVAAVGVGLYLYSENQKKKEAGTTTDDGGGGGGGGGGGVPLPPIFPNEQPPAPKPAPFVCPVHPDPRKIYICTGTRVTGEAWKTGTRATSAESSLTIKNMGNSFYTADPNKLFGASRTGSSTTPPRGSTTPIVRQQSGGNVVTCPTGYVYNSTTKKCDYVGRGETGSGGMLFTGKNNLTLENLLN